MECAAFEAREEVSQSLVRACLGHVQLTLSSLPSSTPLSTPQRHSRERELHITPRQQSPYALYGDCCRVLVSQGESSSGGLRVCWRGWTRGPPSPVRYRYQHAYTNHCMFCIGSV